jgi:hypothetical protein
LPVTEERLALLFFRPGWAWEIQPAATARYSGLPPGSKPGDFRQKLLEKYNQ